MQLVLDCKILYCSDLNSLCETGIGNFLTEAEAEYQRAEALAETGIPGAGRASTQGYLWRSQGPCEEFFSDYKLSLLTFALG